MQKIALGLCLSLVMFVGACGGAVAEPQLEATCVQDDTCAALNPTFKCCSEDKTLQKDATKCPVTPGLLGGMPMRCM